jgi:hypothetical protein
MSLSNIKEIFTTLLGVLLMVFSLTNYFFEYPKPLSLVYDIPIFIVGFVLLWVDPKKIANAAFTYLKNKFGK